MPSSSSLRDLLLVGGYKLVVPRGYEFEVSRLGKIATWGLYASIGFVLVTEQGTQWPVACFWINLALAVIAAGPVPPQGAARGAALTSRLTSPGRETARGGRNRHLGAQSLKLRLTPSLRCIFDHRALPTGKATVETLPDLLSLSDDELSALLAQIEDAEDAISRRRRVLHGRIDILRAERTERLKAQVAAGSFETQAADVVRAPDLRGHRRAALRGAISSRCPTSRRWTTTRSGRRSGGSSTRRTTSRSTGG